MKSKAYSLLEMLIVLGIVGVLCLVLMVGMRVTTNKTSNAKLTYSAYQLLKRGVGEYVAKNGMIKETYKLCEFLAELYNASGAINCSASDPTILVSNGTTKFNDENKVNFVLDNGMKFYNLTSSWTNEVSSLQSEITELENKITDLNNNKESYPIADYNTFLDAFTTELENKKKKLSQSYYYMIYVDIDGKRRNGNLNDDVIPFYINTYGEVLPSGVAANDMKYLSAGYKYYVPVAETSGTWVWTWGSKLTTFQQAICKSGINFYNYQIYCMGIDVDSKCSGSSTPCQLVIHN